MEYIRETYGVPAKVGMKVIADGKPGKITGYRGAYLKIKLEGESKSGLWHPTWNMEYIVDA